MKPNWAAARNCSTCKHSKHLRPKDQNYDDTVCLALDGEPIVGHRIVCDIYENGIDTFETEGLITPVLNQGNWKFNEKHIGKIAPDILVRMRGI